MGVGQKMRAVVKHLKQPPLASSSSSFMLRYFVSHPSECPTLACYPSFLPNSWYVGKQWVLYSSKCMTLLKGRVSCFVNLHTCVASAAFTYMYVYRSDICVYIGQMVEVAYCTHA